MHAADAATSHQQQLARTCFVWESALLLLLLLLLLLTS